jgi:hypothetical protein
VIGNGSQTIGSTAVGLLCFDKAINSASIGNGTVNSLTLYGFGVNNGTDPVTGAFKQTLALTSGSGVTATVNPSLGNCLNVNIPSSATPDGIGADLNGFTVMGVATGAVTDTSGRPSVGASVGVTTSPANAEISPQSGETSGSKLAGVLKNPGAPNQIAYVFNRFISAFLGFANASNFGYVRSNGTVCVGPNAVLNVGNVVQNTVAVTFTGGACSDGTNPAPVQNDVRYFVKPKSILTQTQDVPNPGDASGTTVATAPTIVSSAPVPGVPGAFDLTYDQPVALANSAAFIAYFEDNTNICGTAACSVVLPPTITRPGDPKVLRLTYGSPVAAASSKLVKIVDTGGTGAAQGGGCNQPGATALGGVVQQGAPGCTSVFSEADVATPPAKEGFVSGPNLTGVVLNTAQATVTYSFDGHGGALFNLALGAAGNFRLVNSDGTISATGATAVTITGPNTVVAQFNAAQMTNAVGATIVAGAVIDNQAVVTGGASSVNIAPITSGSGGITTTTTTTSSTTTTTTTTTTSTTTTTTAPGPIHPTGSSLSASRKKKGGNSKIKFNGQIFLPANAQPFKSSLCFGTVQWRVKHRHNGKLKTIASGTVSLGHNCKFSGSVTVSNNSLDNDGGRVGITFRGNQFVTQIGGGPAFF